MGQLDGRVAIITGSNRGIGRGIARRFAREGARLVINGRDADRCQAAADALGEEHGAEVLVVPGDVTDEAVTDALIAGAVERFGAVDVLVNNAWGGTVVGRLEQTPVDRFGAALDLAFRPALRLMQGAFPHMQAAGWGRIVNVTSLNGVNAHAYTADYNAAKEALRSLTRTAAREWFRHGIVVNALCPFARVERHDDAWGEDADAVAAEVGRGLPSGRMGDPEADIGGVAAFLCSEDARFLTGNTLFADGGGHISGIPWNPDPDAGASTAALRGKQGKQGAAK